MFEIRKVLIFFLILSVNGTCLLRSTSPNFIIINQYYRNYEHHPWRIVRAYRKTRNWLTDHFVLSDQRFENIYSFSFLVVVGIALIITCYLNLQMGGAEGGYDVDKTQSNRKIQK